MEKLWINHFAQHVVSSLPADGPLELLKPNIIRATIAAQGNHPRGLASELALGCKGPIRRGEGIPNRGSRLEQVVDPRHFP